MVIQRLRKTDPIDFPGSREPVREILLAGNGDIGLLETKALFEFADRGRHRGAVHPIAPGLGFVLPQGDENVLVQILQRGPHLFAGVDAFQVFPENLLEAPALVLHDMNADPRYQQQDGEKPAESEKEFLPDAEHDALPTQEPRLGKHYSISAALAGVTGIFQRERIWGIAKCNVGGGNGLKNEMLKSRTSSSSATAS